MESLRVRNSAPDKKRKILLPVSFGVSSVTLLHIVDHHLKTQISKTGRTGFTLTVLFVDDASINQQAPDRALLIQARERYPDHEYVTVSLQHVFRAVPDDVAFYDQIPGLSSKEDASESEKLSVLLNSLTSATARADVIPILRTRLIVEEAKRLGCEGILWGDTTTKLAERTLAETAKGRGFSLPWQIADGESPLGITFNYPLRDVLKKELIAYVDFSEPSLLPLIHANSIAATHASMSSKNTTIDDLMKQYFESVEENFPSIVSNVVRTTSKLSAVASSDTDAHCNFCYMPVADGRFGIHGWGGDQEDGLEAMPTEPDRRICYGCTRSIPHLTTSTNGVS